MHDFVYKANNILKSVVDGRLLNQGGVCGMGAVRLCANTGFSMGRALGLMASKLCCWVFGIGGALGYKEHFLWGLGYS